MSEKGRTFAADLRNDLNLMKKILIMALITGAAGLASCTATRTVTTTASYVQHGDTTTTIMTKTTETYRGEKH
jgi:hypothetical protein